jgi:hypothetical protein
MSMPLDVLALCKEWVHSKEEDTRTATVYRPAGYAFPPSRGRTGVVFNQNGTLKWIGIGPTDISAVKDGSWRIADPHSLRIQVEVNNTHRELSVESLDGDRLVISKMF